MPTPTGTMLEDGFVCVHEIDGYPTIQLWQKEVTPPGWEGGGEINLTNMHCVRFRIAAPKKLITIKGAQMVCFYDTEIITDLADVIQLNALITTTFADGSKHKWWGWLDSFVPNSNSEGKDPNASCVFGHSNRNDSGVETGPVWEAAA